MSVYILAEIASAHCGDPELCIDLIHAAKEAGADGVKVQVWFPEEGDFSHMMDKRILWPDVLARAPRGFELWGQWYGDESKRLCRTYCDRLISGRSKIEHEKTYIHGKQNYPTELRDAGLSSLGANWNGYADHTRAPVLGEWKWEFIVPAMAIAAGATLIEKHICLNREELKKKSKDWVSALEPYEFKEFVAFLRVAEAAL